LPGPIAVSVPLHINGTFDLLTFEPVFFPFLAAFFAALLSALFAIFRNLLCLPMMFSISNYNVFGARRGSLKVQQHDRSGSDRRPVPSSCSHASTPATVAAGSQRPVSTIQCRLRHSKACWKPRRANGPNGQLSIFMIAPSHFVKYATLLRGQADLPW
jgi:hypothetical protein